ncbi:hypothetical protein CIT26_07070 [Mesorhizobium temperatum]|uniref:Uncharacterized protein n=1 Tax=Mesorhizobium temperatum TaxID=241416 RepID=A0A271LSI1_9HYPH|nr:hypothetical protein CIT26_07070 [Mesorhizobium temperatum]
MRHIGDVVALPIGRAIARIAPLCDPLCIAGRGGKVKQAVAVDIGERDPLVRSSGQMRVRGPAAVSSGMGK